MDCVATKMYTKLTHAAPDASLALKHSQLQHLACRIAVKKPAGSSGFLSSLPASAGTGLSLAPPPGGSGSFGLAPPPSSSAAGQVGRTLSDPSFCSAQAS